eukprot:4932800-Prymnesium_polylepis.1
MHVWGEGFEVFFQSASLHVRVHRALHATCTAPTEQLYVSRNNGARRRSGGEMGWGGGWLGGWAGCGRHRETSRGSVRVRRRRACWPRRIACARTSTSLCNRGSPQSGPADATCFCGHDADSSRTGNGVLHSHPALQWPVS